MNTLSEFDFEFPPESCLCGCRGNAALHEAEPEWTGEAWRQRRSPRRLPPPRTTPRAARPQSPKRRPKPGYRPGGPRGLGRVYVHEPYPVAYPYEPEPASDPPQEPGSEYNRWVQDCLNRILNLRLPVNGLLDAAPRSAIRRLQKQESLPITGIVSPGTEQALRRLCGDGNEPADRKGQAEWGESKWEWEGEVNRTNRDYIRWVQASLNKVLGIRLAVDGVMGAQTRSAIRSFQKRQRLKVDGIVGPRTDEALRTALTDGLQRPGGLPPEPACTTLDHFPKGTDTILPAHQPKLIALARRILAEHIRNVDITGFASSEGSDTENLALRQRRAERVARELRTTLERVRRGSSRAVTLITTSRGEREQIAGGDLQLNRRVTICLQIPRPRPKPTPVVPTRTQVFQVTGKSFIARIGSKVGSLDCGIDTPFGQIPGASNPALRALATLTDTAFSEDPGTDAIFTTPPPEGKGYRLFSRGKIQVVHRGSEILSVSVRGSITTDAGKECVPTTGACL